MKRPRIEVNLGELDQLLDQAQQEPLSEPETIVWSTVEN